jgi:hypothetical protein
MTASIDVFRLASIFIRYRLRSMRNAVRARGRGRTTLFAVVFGAITGLAYAALFAQAFSVIARTVDLTGQLAALVLVITTVAFGSLAARAASAEAVRAGSPENEFLLARPVSLSALVAARGLADAVTDPVAGLFLLPVLVSATVVWDLGPAAWPIALVISILMQVAISSLAYAVQLAVVRYVPGRRRRVVWTGLRMVAALSLALVWMLGTYVMRAPAKLAATVATLGSVVSLSPATLAGAPLAALARGEPLRALLGLVVLAASVGATLLIVIAFARRAGMAGWEEAGAVWAETTPVPPPTARLPTAATKDLRLIVRDRSQLLALIALPAIFIGVQIFGAAGWSWTTANLGRISCFAFSLALYMGTIGPLTHMQAERRAFWILRAVPVPLGRLLGAKARAWALIMGGMAAAAFAVLSLSVPGVSVGARLGAGLLVTVGSAGVAFIAVAMASGGADLSDETNTAVGPGTIYAYLLVGGLFNLMLVEQGAVARVAGLALYAFAGWAYWQAGVEQAGFCLDAEMVRTRRVRAADGATMLIVYALGGRALQSGAKAVADGSRDPRLAASVALVSQVALLCLVGIAAAVHLKRGPKATARRRLLPSLLLGAAAGGFLAAVLRAVSGPGPAWPPALLGASLLSLLVEELMLRGVVQRALQEQEQFATRMRGGAAVISAAAGVVVTAMWIAPTGGASQLAVQLATQLATIAVVQTVAAVVYASTGRVASSCVARAVIVGVAAFA